MNKNLFERSFSLDYSIECAMKEVSAHDLFFCINLQNDNGAIFTKADLYDYKRNFITTGMGKGFSNQAAIAGALFESLEHFFSAEYCNKPETIKAKDLDDCLEHDFVISMIKENHPDEKISICKYKNLLNGELIAYPAKLVFPESRYKSEHENSYQLMVRYSSGNGRTIGVSRIDALIHGINEMVERHAISLFLSRYFLANQEAMIPLCLINHLSLDDEIQEYLKIAERFINCKIGVIQLENEFGIPTFMAVPLELKYNDYPIYGSGSSLSIKVALTRAISELVQFLYNFIKDPQLLSGFDEKLGIISKYPALINSYKISIQSYPNIQYVCLKKYNDNDNDKLTTEQQLNHQLNIIKESGYELLEHIIYQSSYTCCLSLIIPGLDRFYMVTSGNVVAPSKRAIKTAEVLYK